MPFNQKYYFTLQYEGLRVQLIVYMANNIERGYWKIYVVKKIVRNKVGGVSSDSSRVPKEIND